MATAAQLLAQWIESEHPDFFQYVAGQVAQGRLNRSQQRASLRGFGQGSEDYSYDYTSPDYTPAPDAIASQYTPEPVDIPTVSASDLTAISTGADAASSVGDLSVTPEASSGGFLSSLGSGLSNAASSVASFLSSPQGLTDITKLAGAYFQVKNTQATAALQTQILQAQATRAAYGQAPAPVTYGYNAQGQLVPIYSAAPISTSGGALMYPSNMPASLVASISAGHSQYVTLPDGTQGYTLPSNIVGSLSSNVSLTELLPWLLVIVGGLMLLG